MNHSKFFSASNINRIVLCHKKGNINRLIWTKLDNNIWLYYSSISAEEAYNILKTYSKIRHINPDIPLYLSISCTTIKVTNV